MSIAIYLPESVRHAAIEAGAQAMQVVDPKSVPRPATVVKKVPGSEHLNDEAIPVSSTNATAEPADAKTAAFVTNAINGFNDRLPDMARNLNPPPSEIRVAADDKVFIRDGNEINLSSSTHQEDGKAVETITMSKGAAALMKSDPGAFQALLAHEHAHHVQEMNPGLEKDPLFKPKSKEYNDELARVDFGRKMGVSEEEAIEQSKKFYKDNHIPWTPEAEAATREGWENNRQAMAESNKAIYNREGFADKLGLWMNPDLEASQRFQAMIAMQQHDSPVPNQDPAALQKKTDEHIGLEFDPHPSSTARMAEEAATAEEIRKANGADAIHNTASPTQPAHVPHVPPAAGQQVPPRH